MPNFKRILAGQIKEKTMQNVEGLMTKQIKEAKTMKNFEDLLQKQIEELDVLIRKTEGETRKLEKLPEGRLRVSSHRGVPQYYLKEAGKKECFVKAKDREKVRAYAQKSYNLRILGELRSRKALLEECLRRYRPDDIGNVYQSMCSGRKQLVNPIEPTDEMFIAEWLKRYEGGKNTFPEERIFPTEAGEMVRSKSEKILADYFFRAGIVYRYEPQVIFDDGKTVYPDFAVLNLRLRKTFYWEHLGIVSDDDYASKNFRKIELYEKNGILLGDRLIVSMESRGMSLDVGLIKKKVEEFLV